MSKAIRIYKKKGDTIKARYGEGDSIDELCEYAKCSYNTMMVVLGMLGFPSTDYFKPQIEAKMKYLEEDKKRRTAVA